jgi:hypothetical protein
MYWFGLNILTERVEVFYSKKVPTYETHSKWYGCVWGGYRTKDIAFEKASYQYASDPVFIDKRKKENR